MDRINILIVDDHSIVRQGIRSLLSNYAEFRIVGEADSGAAALEQVRQQTPDVTLLDIRMPDESGLEVLRQIRQIQPGARVLMLTSFDDDEYVMGALRAGAQGFILKSVSDEMLVNAIRVAHRGERILSPQITDQVVRWALSDQSEPILVSPNFDGDEQEILHRLTEGASNTEIADQMYMSHTTVKRKLRTIFAKLNVQTRAQAAAEAVRRGLA
ncbi:MAG TPA: response regulator transcription factor [Anaerolineae bacterium]